jgi:LacI family transcriptional regulator
MNSAEPHKSSIHVAVFLDEAGCFSRDVLRGIVRHQNELPCPWSLMLVMRLRLEVPSFCLNQWARRGSGIIARVDSPEVELALQTCGLPVVNLSGALEKPAFPTCIQDAARAARLAVDVFCERGFRHFAFVGFEDMHWSVESARCFKSLLEERGWPCAELTFFFEDMRADRIGARLTSWLWHLSQPLALWASDDELAFHVVNACLRAGIRVPEQVAVLGMDDDEMLCEAATPPISSITSNAEEIGYRAARRLRRLMNGQPDDEPQVVNVPPRSVRLRRSTDLHAVDDPHVAKALRIIEQEACSGLRVVDLIAQVPVARRLLERRFKAALGRTLLQEIWRVQCRQAAELMESTKLPMLDIAERCGYEHPEHFSAVFKKVMGLPPGAYRKQHIRSKCAFALPARAQ